MKNNQPAYLDFRRMAMREAVDREGCRLYTGYAGAFDTPALVFVHGGFHGAWCFNHYLDYFAKKQIACYAVDLPGHGELASEMTPDIGLEVLANSLLACISSMARPVVLVGHSVGAIPVMWTATQFELSGLVLLAPSPPGNLPGARALPTVPTDHLKAPPSRSEVRQRYLGVDADVCVESIVDLMCPESPRVLNERYALQIPIDPKRIICPGICLEAGMDDVARHPAGQDQAIARFLSIEHMRLAAHPHCMMYGPLWRESASALLAWYRRSF